MGARFGWEQSFSACRLELISAHSFLRSAVWYIESSDRIRVRAYRVRVRARVLGLGLWLGLVRVGEMA